MGKSIRSKIKKHHRSIKRKEEGPTERLKRAMQAVALGALPMDQAPRACFAQRCSARPRGHRARAPPLLPPAAARRAAHAG